MRLGSVFAESRPGGSAVPPRSAKKVAPVLISTTQPTSTSPITGSPSPRRAAATETQAASKPAIAGRVPSIGSTISTHSGSPPGVDQAPVLGVERDLGGPLGEELLHVGLGALVDREGDVAARRRSRRARAPRGCRAQGGPGPAQGDGEVAYEKAGLEAHRAGRRLAATGRAARRALRRPARCSPSRRTSRVTVSPGGAQRDQPGEIAAAGDRLTVHRRDHVAVDRRSAAGWPGS